MQMSRSGPSRYLLRLHKGGRRRGEPDVDEGLRAVPWP